MQVGGQFKTNRSYSLSGIYDESCAGEETLENEMSLYVGCDVTGF